MTKTKELLTGTICFICLVFLFFETAFGICLGCKFYPLFFKEKSKLCAGDVCDIKSKQDIQKTSGIQLLIVLAFVAFIFLMGWLFNDQLVKKPNDLFGIDASSKSKSSIMPWPSILILDNSDFLTH